ncbi:MAG: GLPGLI family protein [Chitinophagaceae bacterium]|nr:MAG: GLPGLI family protein [Chitinophagaceae bacterium]
MKKLILIALCNLAVLGGFSQTSFVTSGKIEFERKVNLHRQMTAGETGDWIDGFKKLIPQFRIDYFSLVFNENKALYSISKEDASEASTMFFNTPAMDNSVFTDYKDKVSVSNKLVFESRFLLTDSLVNRKWRIEPETRTIAGFECRKAVTAICDSVVVVAFYTDQIIPQGGPESFSGLPGMILGLAVPRLYTTWFATKLEVITAADETKIVAPAKGKKANYNDMNASVTKAIKTYGPKFFDRSIWSVTL